MGTAQGGREESWGQPGRRVWDRRGPAGDVWEEPVRTAWGGEGGAHGDSPGRCGVGAVGTARETEGGREGPLGMAWGGRGGAVGMARRRVWDPRGPAGEVQGGAKPALHLLVL